MKTLLIKTDFSGKNLFGLAEGDFSDLNNLHVDFFTEEQKERFEEAGKATPYFQLSKELDARILNETEYKIAIICTGNFIKQFIEFESE